MWAANVRILHVPGTPKFRVPGTSVSGRHRVALSTLSVRVGTTPSDTFNSVNVFGKQNLHICSPHTVELSTFDRQVQSSVTHPAHVLTMIYIGFVIVHPAHVLIMSSSCPHHVLIMSSSCPHHDLHRVCNTSRSCPRQESVTQCRLDSNLQS